MQEVLSIKWISICTDISSLINKIHDFLRMCTLWKIFGNKNIIWNLFVCFHSLFMQTNKDRLSQNICNSLLVPPNVYISAMRKCLNLSKSILLPFFKSVVLWALHTLVITNIDNVNALTLASPLVLSPQQWHKSS